MTMDDEGILFSGSGSGAQKQQQQPFGQLECQPTGDPIPLVDHPDVCAHVNFCLSALLAVHLLR